MVLRLLDKSALKLDLDQLGFDQWCLEQFQKAVKSPHGLILVTGPTGSGKTRLAIYEVLPITREIRDLMVGNATTTELCKAARGLGE